MGLVELLNDLKERLRKGGLSQEEILTLPNENLVELLKALYTYNHGDKICSAWEYCAKAGNKENGGGDYSQLQKELLYLGYQIEEVVFEEIYYKLPSMAEDYEKRKQEMKFFPREVKYFIISNQLRQRFALSECPNSLDLLADAGDERAFWTRESFRRKGGYYIGQKQYKR